ncbi:MAG TPA: tyrosine-protein phosphatase [Dermatophilaceae bacterium]|nr:tyrosine-protein phosphatase [Dermatophilaceae bacterium]
MTTGRWIELDGVANMRDVGGLPTRDGRTVRPRRLLRSDNLQDLSDADVTHLVEVLGVSDIVDLRSETELHASGPGPLRRVGSLSHHHHSLLPERVHEDADQVARQALVVPRTSTPDRRDARFWAEHYLGYLSERPDSVSAALDVIARSTGATVVHCAAGKDRTGTVVGMALDVAGVPPEEIVADYVLTSERIDRILDRLRSNALYSEALRERDIAAAEQSPRPEAIEAILRTVTEGYGGADGWLRAHGWSADEVARLRDRLTR